MKKKALVLFSGGLDSTTIYHLALEEGYLPYALSFDYGQRHIYELTCAKNFVKRMPSLGHSIIKLDPILFSTSALVNPKMSVPENKYSEDVIPATYVPARNILFLSFATAMAENLNIRDIFIGINAVDYSGYPDCRPEFLDAFQKSVNLGTKSGVEGDQIRFHAPLLFKSKQEIILLANKLKVDFSKTSSCYNPNKDGLPCGKCDSCFLRINGFLKAGMNDSLRYQ